MPVTALAPQASASANSATFARGPLSYSRALGTSRRRRPGRQRGKDRFDDLGDLERLLHPADIVKEGFIGQPRGASADEDEDDPWGAFPETGERAVKVGSQGREVDQGDVLLSGGEEAPKLRGVARESNDRTASQKGGLQEERNVLVVLHYQDPNA